MISFTKSLLENMFTNEFNRNRRGEEGGQGGQEEQGGQGAATQCCLNSCTFETLKTYCSSILPNPEV